MHYISHLSNDKKLKKVIDVQEPHTLVKRKKIYLYLCASIMSQQLSTKVADVIYNRFLALYGKKEPTAQQILDTPFDTLRGIGLSNAKTNYVQNVCRFFLQHELTDARLYKMKDEEVIELLTQIKGVGKWTVEMILMFALQHEDVLPVDDLGIQQAMTKLYNLKYETKKELYGQMIQRAEKWRPYRTYACLHLWRWKDTE
ncbi:MAG: DNA-3-methyladenine glycosylase 2 family protein [Chitinophagaceae bacterium]|nr:DNA-3-methyladenine glycosylase 2 family protein [Chitinophagaceae bacterium]